MATRPNPWTQSTRQPHTTSHPCDDADPEIDFNGSSAPQVEELDRLAPLRWNVGGDLVVRFDPNDFASLDDNVARPPTRNR